jgi:hypothetical protein
MGTMERYQGKSLSRSAKQTGWKCLEDVVKGVKMPCAQHGRPDIKVCSSGSSSGAIPALRSGTSGKMNTTWGLRTRKLCLVAIGHGPAVVLTSPRTTRAAR